GAGARTRWTSSRSADRRCRPPILASESLPHFAGHLHHGPAKTEPLEEALSARVLLRRPQHDPGRALLLQPASRRLDELRPHAVAADRIVDHDVVDESRRLRKRRVTGDGGWTLAPVVGWSDIRRGWR